MHHLAYIPEGLCGSQGVGMASEAAIKEMRIQRWIHKGHSRKAAERLADMEERNDPRLRRK